MTKFQVSARGRAVRHRPGIMNNTEKLYADTILAIEKLSGEIVEWWHEQFTFKLADDLRYTPDFVVQYPDGLLEVREIKGFMREDAHIKLKIAAQIFPFRFIAISKINKRDGGGWKIVEF